MQGEGCAQLLDAHSYYYLLPGHRRTGSKGVHAREMSDSLFPSNPPHPWSSGRFRARRIRTGALHARGGTPPKCLDWLLDAAIHSGRLSDAQGTWRPRAFVWRASPASRDPLSWDSVGGRWATGRQTWRRAAGEAASDAASRPRIDVGTAWA